MLANALYKNSRERDRGGRERGKEIKVKREGGERETEREGRRQKWERQKERETEREKERGRERQRERDRGREREGRRQKWERQKERETEREKERGERDRGREREGERVCERDRERERSSELKIVMTHINIPECYKKLSLFFATTKFYSWMKKFHLRGVLGYLRKYEGSESLYL